MEGVMPSSIDDVVILDESIGVSDMAEAVLQDCRGAGESLLNYLYFY
jgi:hypothetical protein